MKQEHHKFVLRLPMDVRNRVVEAASRYRRSMNSEIVARLELSFSGGFNDSAAADVAPPLHPHLEYVLRSGLNESEQLLIKGFRRLEQKKRQALLNLLS